MPTTRLVCEHTLLDATYVKASRDHNIVSFAIIIAVGANTDGRRERRCCMDLGCGRSCPSPGCGSGDADGDRGSQLQHTVERMDGNVHLGRSAPVRARAALLHGSAFELGDDIERFQQDTFGVDEGVGEAQLIRGRNNSEN